MVFDVTDQIITPVYTIFVTCKLFSVFCVFFHAEFNNSIRNFLSLLLLCNTYGVLWGVLYSTYILEHLSLFIL
jgi:hypothetical protein